MGLDGDMFWALGEVFLSPKGTKKLARRNCVAGQGKVVATPSKAEG